jgi:hypothetical protein
MYPSRVMMHPEAW